MMIICLVTSLVLSFFFIHVLEFFEDNSKTSLKKCESFNLRKTTRGPEDPRTRRTGTFPTPTSPPRASGGQSPDVSGKTLTHRTFWKGLIVLCSGLHPGVCQEPRPSV